MSDPAYDPSASPLPIDADEPPPGPALCFAPHPDDEVIGPGGALCLHRRRGDAVRVVIATDGVAGDPDGLFDAASYAARRRGESRAGLDGLGVADVAFWGYPDSCVVGEADLTALARRAAEEIDAFAPGVIYLPWEGESNSDHRALHAAVVRAIDTVGFDGLTLGYEVWTSMVPDLILDITTVAEDKRRAVRCYGSQLRYVDYEHTIFGLHAHRSLQFRRGRGWSEAFRRVAGAISK